MAALGAALHIPMGMAGGMPPKMPRDRLSMPNSRPGGDDNMDMDTGLERCLTLERPAVLKAA